MNTQAPSFTRSNLIVAYQIVPSLARHARRLAVRCSRLVGLLLVICLSFSQGWDMQSAAAAGPTVTSLVDLAHDGQGDLALQQVAAAAIEHGGWGPAPGDEIVFDRFMARNVRGAVQDYDELPIDCADPQVSVDEQECIEHFQAFEHQVRFGPALFATWQADGTAVPRPAFDDLLSTFIEESGHSWQEYLYETGGLAQGPRTRQTTKADSEQMGPGREYQVKRYILSLDGTWLSLSDQQRDALHGAICGGYADPRGQAVPSYGPPPGWPNPSGWPTDAPSSEDLAVFCATD
ncbi:MAG: hypothetical protein JXJ20_01660 [Anaerolineae bacterium]|nr:hypothetical protein [Anaerolineae bacterium]